MMKKILILFVALLAACTRPDESEKALAGAGYRDIKMRGYSMFGCSKDDHYHDKFTAVDLDGHQVSGVVCAGLFFKGMTIRID